MNNNTVTAIIRRFGLLLLPVLLLLTAALPAAAQSMIPDDFDWSIYQEDDDWDSWGSAPQPGYGYDYGYGNGYSYGYEEPFSYDWYGQSYQVDNSYSVPDTSWDDSGWWENTPQQTTGTVPQTTTVTDDGWFYLSVDDYFDDWDSWTGTVEVPVSAYVSGFVGYAQSYNLDCEARSAVDLAAYFGVNIAHSDFLARMPRSDDPNVGFVGNYTDTRGKIPPSSYGIYQEPVAELLRQYGLNAVSAYAYTENALKAQIAAGHPVMVWVVGNTEIGYSVPYTPASTGRTTLVVPYQHTVVVIGYDANNVTLQDGAMKYTRPWSTFLVSWGALGNRAVYVP